MRGAGPDPAVASRATRVVVLADTHVGDGTRRRLPDAAYRHLDGADLILHAGDLVSPDLLDELGGFAPVEAVLGNNDRDLVGILPETRELTVAGVRIALVHDSGARAGRPARMHRRFPGADVVVFGHSHEPCDLEGVDGQRLLNPGSATWKRRAPTHTLAVLELADGEIRSTTLVDLDPPAGR
ncbi:MAG: Phosphoesterase [Acidimicrobiales bacterium]|nr:Phosphoesterase [Acidimicrobiales bacterium]